MPTVYTDPEPQPLLDERRLRALVLDWRLACGKRLQARRRALGLSQLQLAVLVAVQPTAISKFELGTVAPKDSIRLAIACALSCGVEDIWPPIDRHQAMLVARSAA